MRIFAKQHVEEKHLVGILKALEVRIFSIFLN